MHYFYKSIYISASKFRKDLPYYTQHKIFYNPNLQNQPKPIKIFQKKKNVHTKP